MGSRFSCSLSGGAEQSEEKPWLVSSTVSHTASFCTEETTVQASAVCCITSNGASLLQSCGHISDSVDFCLFGSVSLEEQDSSPAFAQVFLGSLHSKPLEIHCCFIYHNSLLKEIYFFKIMTDKLIYKGAWSGRVVFCHQEPM